METYVTHAKGTSAMLTYSIEQDIVQGFPVYKTLHMKGKADSTQWERLRAVFFDSLTSCDHLTVNIDNVEEYDYSFTILICSTRRTAQLLGKRLTIAGKATDSFPCIYEHTLHSQNIVCSFPREKTCFLWERHSRRPPVLSGKRKNLPVGKRSIREIQIPEWPQTEEEL